MGSDARLVVGYGNVGCDCYLGTMSPRCRVGF